MFPVSGDTDGPSPGSTATVCIPSRISSVEWPNQMKRGVLSFFKNNGQSGDTVGSNATGPYWPSR